MNRVRLRFLALAALLSMGIPACSHSHAEPANPIATTIPQPDNEPGADGEGDPAATEDTREDEPLVEEDTRTPRQRFIDAVAIADWDTAHELVDSWTAEHGDVDGITANLRLQIHDGEFREARTSARALFGANPDQREYWLDLYYDAFQADPELWAPAPRTLVPGEDFDSLRSLGGGSTVTIRVDRGDETIAVFKPHSTLEQSYYRGEIAAYRLCELIDCGFSVPKNEEVRIRVDDFVAAYGIQSLTSARPGTYARRFRDLIVFTDEDGQQWIHGTLKAWAPGFTTYPVEHTEGWLWLLNGSRTREQLDNMTLEDALRPMRGRERAYVAGMLERRGETTGIDFARQLSNLHVFDMLLNNWDRYSGQFYGVNCQWNHGQFVSIDNGATLQKESWGSNTTTRARQRRVRVYSRSTVDAIRYMDLDRVREILLPPSPWHTDEDERFARFAQAREDFLTWLDDQIARRGEENVLLLD